jgi:Tfp pilus assembly protein PilX
MKNSPPSLRRYSHPRETGIALVTVLIMMVVIAILVSITSILAIGNRRTSKDTMATTQAQYAAEAGIEMALKKIYYDPYDAWKASANDSKVKNANGETVAFDTCAFKKWLTGIYKSSTPAEIATLADNNASGCAYVNFTDQVTNAPLPNLTNNKTINLSNTDLGMTAVTGAKYQVSVNRSDEKSGAVNLQMNALGQVVSSDGKIIAERRISRSVKISGEVFEGDKFAMLTTATNCSFCHLQIDSMRRAYSSTGTFDRVRMGVVSSTTNLGLSTHGDNPDVLIYGALYTRKDKTTITWGAGGKKVRYATQTNGKVSAGPNATNIGGDIKDDNSIAWNAAVNSTVAGDGNGANKPNGILYYNYPTAAQVKDPAGIYKGKWPDGVLPDTFPAAIPDGGDGNISDLDWSSYVATAPAGSLIDTGTGTTAAVIYGVRRPGSSNVAADIPSVYDPITANGLTDKTTTGTATVVTNATTIAEVTTNAVNYKKWWVLQALSTPNNRDLLPTTPTSTNLPFSRSVTNGSYQNNFYTNYNPTSSTLSLFYCNATALTNLAGCARSGDPTGAAATNTLSTVSVTGIDDTVFFPQTSNSARADLISGYTGQRKGLFDGNVIIDAGRINGGRNAFKIDGTILINGDLVIRGRILGQGRIVARGNIYVVGDLVYDCNNGTAACVPSNYGTPETLPKVALLAGGNVVVGDYDAPDSRMNQRNRAFDLVNDQASQNRRPSSGSTGVNWEHWSVPGSTGRGPRGNSGSDTSGTTDANPIATAPNYADGNWSGWAGFMVRNMAGNVNNRAAAKQYYRLNPFGYMITSGTQETYESGFLNGTANGSGSFAVTVPMIPVYPSNGPLRIGSNATSGLAGTAVTGVGCNNTTVLMPLRRYWNQGNWTRVNTSTGATSTATVASGSSIGSNLIPAANFNFAYWCPPNAGSYVRRDDTSLSGSNNPGTVANANVWMAQGSLDAALDSSVGMTTGWLAGAMQYNGNWVRGDLSQTRLLKLMWLSTMERSTRYTPKMPLRTDGIFYSANLIASLLRGTQDTRTGESSTQGRWIHNGSVIASELSFLIPAAPGTNTSGFPFTLKRTTNIDFNPGTTGTPGGIDTNTADGGTIASSPTTDGTWGPGFGIFYDDRLIGFLNVTNTNEVKIKRTGVFAQVVSK